MGRFTTTGIDDIMKKLVYLGDAAEAVGDEMLLAGAEEVKKAWKKSAERHKLRDTGDMIASIGYARKPKSVGGVRVIDIYPQGKNRRGVRNAEVAAVTHYGTSKFPATHWVDEADAEAGPKAQEAMEQVYYKHLEEKGLL
jgi:HK97 gp10 family phage protein